MARVIIWIVGIVDFLPALVTATGRFISSMNIARVGWSMASTSCRCLPCDRFGRPLGLPDWPGLNRVRRGGFP
jgi:hypothetical protein